MEALVDNGPTTVLYAGSDPDLAGQTGQIVERLDRVQQALVAFGSDKLIDQTDLVVGYWSTDGARAFCLAHAAGNDQVATSEPITLGENDLTGFATGCSICGIVLVEDPDERAECSV